MSNFPLNVAIVMVMDILLGIVRSKLKKSLYLRKLSNGQIFRKLVLLSKLTNRKEKNPKQRLEPILVRRGKMQEIQYLLIRLFPYVLWKIRILLTLKKVRCFLWR